ncbi:MAG TPA: ATP-binding protein [Vicinamibacteria bacterium]|nr:ATP-binding protein [Vicinamibacteria bacterium]
MTALDDGRAQAQTRFLADAGALFVASLDPETILRNLARLAVPDVADACLVDLLAEDRKVLRVAVAHRDPTRADRAWDVGAPSEDGVPEAIRTSRPVLLATVGPEALGALGRGPRDQSSLAGLGLSSAVAAPLVARGRTLGAIVLASVDGGRAYDEVDLAFVKTLAERTALAVDNARLFRQAQDAGRLKDEFLGALSHELRAPLNAIMGWAHVLRSGPVDPAILERAVGAIDRNVQLQTHLISNVLDLSRMVTGRLRLNVGVVEPGAIVEAAAAALRPEAARRDVTIATAIDRRPGVLSGDAERLQQVVSNLIANAVRAVPRSGRVDVRVAKVEGLLRIEVQDNGTGIGADLLPHVFDRFRPTDESTTRPTTGVELGLAIVRHLVELHGGSVHAASRGHGQGATFTVTLPVTGPSTAADLRAAGTGGTAAAEPRVALPSLAGVRVLVVDDEKDTRDVVSAVLSQQGAEVAAASSVDEALAHLSSSIPDVLLADIGMPDEDGYSLMRRIRALPASRGGTVPAAALTAYARAEDRMQALLAGFQIHVPKPVQPGELIRVVGALAARRPAGRLPGAS